MLVLFLSCLIRQIHLLQSHIYGICRFHTYECTHMHIMQLCMNTISNKTLVGEIFTICLAYSPKYMYFVLVSCSQTIIHTSHLSIVPVINTSCKMVCVTLPVPVQQMLCQPINCTGHTATYTIPKIGICFFVICKYELQFRSTHKDGGRH